MTDLLDELAQEATAFLVFLFQVVMIATLLLLAIVLLTVAFPVVLASNLLAPVPAEQAWRETMDLFSPWRRR